MFLIWQVGGSLQRRRRLLPQQQIMNGNNNGTMTGGAGADGVLREPIENYDPPSTDSSVAEGTSTTTPHGLQDDEMNKIGTAMASCSHTSSNHSSTNRKVQLFSLNVKYRNASTTCEVSSDQTVADLKSTILKRFRISPTESLDNYRLIYCGGPLKEEALLQDLKLESESHLHVVKIDAKDTLHLSSNGFSGLTPSDYFIYCPACKKIQASKLRTKCSKCSTLILFLIGKDHEPKCREDVLSCPTVRGTCGNSECDSTEAKFIFQCRQSHQFTNSAPLKHIRNNARHILCITCEEVHTPVIVFPCEKQHTMCLNCFKIYCAICLNERRFQQTDDHGYTLWCPARCPNSHIQDAHHFHILGPEEYERYKRFGTEECLIQWGGVICPQPTCGQGLLPETNSNTIKCTSCEHEFCRQCSFDSHYGDCGRQQAMESTDSGLPSTDVLIKCQMENESQSLIHQISKPCPKCNVKTEKNGGCNHMHCRCGEEWCWICVKTWNQDCMDAHWLD